jgi:DNA-binding NarL/FixJ family response regulator
MKLPSLPAWPAEPVYRRYRLLVVDDHQEFINIVRRILSADPLIEIVGCATTGEEACAKVVLDQPDLVLMDVSMPGMSGLMATSRIKAQSEPPLVVILTLHNHPDFRAASTAAHADGFLLKTEIATELLPLLHSLLA